MVERRPSLWSLKARWLFPVEGSPLEEGVITVQGEHIVRVASHATASPDLDLGNCAILPGLVNVHTHLDLSGLRGQAPPTEDFTDWLRTVIRHRRGLSPERVAADIQAGLSESLAYGTTLLGDISGGGLSWPILAAAPLRSVVFYELLGLPRPRARLAWREARAWLHAHPATSTCRPGLSPHAPYSVRAALFRTASSYARQHQLPLATHLAETLAELQLLQQHQGPFVDFLSELGVWDADGLIQGPNELLGLYAEPAHPLFIHGNYLDPVVPIPRGATIVYCPRTHAAFGHSPHPFRSFLAAGVRVALGTDSLASNPDLDVLAEARFLHRLYPDVPGSVLLRLATLAGAEALGWGQQTGSLIPGKSADLVVLPLEARDTPDPHQLVLESDEPVRAVLCRGQWVQGMPAS
jgi:cytosine/adenosine deaminase-related metal-dependent hydrolase